eukprot:1149525-Pelagomonas_calceolata.AAC.3
MAGGWAPGIAVCCSILILHGTALTCGRAWDCTFTATSKTRGRVAPGHGQCAQAQPHVQAVNHLHAAKVFSLRLFAGTAKERGNMGNMAAWSAGTFAALKGTGEKLVRARCCLYYCTWQLCSSCCHMDTCHIYGCSLFRCPD